MLLLSLCASLSLKDCMALSQGTTCRASTDGDTNTPPITPKNELRGNRKYNGHANRRIPSSGAAFGDSGGLVPLDAFEPGQVLREKILQHDRERLDGRFFTERMQHFAWSWAAGIALMLCARFVGQFVFCLLVRPFSWGTKCCDP